MKAVRRFFCFVGVDCLLEAESVEAFLGGVDSETLAESDDGTDGMAGGLFKIGRGIGISLFRKDASCLADDGGLPRLFRFTGCYFTVVSIALTRSIEL